jgi:hypothetical protein
VPISPSEPRSICSAPISVSFTRISSAVTATARMTSTVTHDPVSARKSVELRIATDPTSSPPASATIVVSRATVRPRRPVCRSAGRRTSAQTMTRTATL